MLPPPERRPVPLPPVTGLPHDPRQLVRPRPLPKMPKKDDLPFALTIHKELVTYIAGEAAWRKLTVPEAVLVVYRMFQADPEAAAENADMLADFDPIASPLTADDLAAIENAVKALNAVDRVLASTM